MVRRPASSKRVRGTTLLETVIASTLLVLFGGTALLVTNSANRSFRTEVVSSELESAARRALADVTEYLRTADANAVTPPGMTSPVSTSVVNYRRGLGFVGGAVQWGDPERITFEYDPGDPDDGVDNDGDGLIDEGRLVHIVNPNLPGEQRVVLCNWVSESLQGELPGNLIDDNGNQLEDEAGFCVVFDGMRATVRLTLARRDKFGYLIDHTFQQSIALRNTQAP